MFNKNINFAKAEEEILKYWKDNECFKKGNELSKDRPLYTFYDGPPFVTGLPHYGHILAGTIKDVICRYYYQKGYHIERQFGWDCHGLPVEYEIDKKLNIKTKEDVEKMGIANYNDECKKIVILYSSE
ncbi:SYIC [Hepatospora eriocheir]|uniref:SYIC n=1 Tax=Hepatospora eriocheir TaxID=1081669 RepID=A0A1X0Q687_9MICR|nr:SYIC [Hepatospora eriocheir]